MTRSLARRFQASAFYPDPSGGPAIVPDTFALALLNDLETRAHLGNAILRGSTLYQPYINALHGFSHQSKPGDYDVLAGFGDYDTFRRDQARWNKQSPADPRFLLDYLSLSGIIKKPEIRFASPPDAERRYFVNVGGVYKGHAIDLFVENIPHTLASVAQNTEAPLTGISMDSQGNFKIHPLFTEHARRLVYDPHTGYGPRNVPDARFEKLSAKFPGLQYAPPVPAPPLVRTRPHP